MEIHNGLDIMEPIIVVNSIDRGLPFNTNDLWRRSCWSEDAEDVESLFAPLDLAQKPIALETFDKSVPHFTFQTEFENLEDLYADENVLDDSVADKAIEPSSLQALETAKDARTGLFDIDILSIEPQHEPQLLSWENFERKSGEKAKPLYLSEAGPRYLNAAFSSTEKTSSYLGVLPQSCALRHLCSLVLGRSSTLFAWSEAKGSFEPILCKASFSGLSQVCTGSVIGDFSEIGAAFVKLQRYAQGETYVQESNAALQALRACILQVVTIVEEHISSKVTSARTILQLQSLMHRPRHLLLLLLAMISTVKNCHTDESLLSTLADFVHSRAEAATHYCSLLRSILARVSVPWLERVGAKIGFRGATTMAESDHFTLDEAQRNQEFVAPDENAMIQQIISAISALRTSTLGHAALSRTTSASRPAFRALIDVTNSPMCMKTIASQHEVAMNKVILQQQYSDGKEMSRCLYAREESTCDIDPNDIWGNSSQERYVANLDSIMSSEPGQNEPDITRGLQQYVMSCLQAEPTQVEMSLFMDIERDQVPLPMERVRPLLETQARLMNGIALRHIFRDCDLLKHLDLQKSFRLFGNGEFVSKLSTALFSPELQSAERKRGVAPHSGTMGLRLGSYDAHKWPPASSELCMVLMDVVSEVNDMQRLRQGRSLSNNVQLRDGLNFVVHELIEENIEQVMDPNSIHALDFLGLQYTAPTPLDRILTVETSRDYHSIFRLLLLCTRLHYMLTNLTKLWRTSMQARSQQSGTSSAYALAQATSHFVSVVFSHFMDLGIEASWRKLVSTAKRVVADLNLEDAEGRIGSKTTVNMDTLCHLHLACLDRIRSRLFLKRRQQKLRITLEEVLANILECVTTLCNSGDLGAVDVDAIHTLFQKSSDRFCNELQEVVEKTPKSRDPQEGEDVEINKILLSRLRPQGSTRPRHR